MLRTWLVSPEGVEQDVSLLPLQLKHLSMPRVRYWGSYPNDVYALVELDHDTCDQHEVAFRYLGPGRDKRFVSSELPEGSSLGSSGGAFAPSEIECESQCAPFGVYDAEEQAAWQRSHDLNTTAPRREHVRLFGHGGPLLVIDDKKLARWTGTSWERAEAPWCSGNAAVRLSNGSSLVPSWTCIGTVPMDTSIFWISQRGKPQPLDLSSLAVEQRLGAIKFGQALELNREIWLIAETDAGIALLAPMIPSELTLPAPRVSDRGDGAR